MRNYFVMLLGVCILTCGGCKTNEPVSSGNDVTTETKLSILETIQEISTEVETEPVLLELDIDITEHYQTSVEKGNHYYIDENNVLWGCGENSSGQLGLGVVDSDIHEEYVKIAENVIHVDYTQYGTLIYITDDYKLYGLGEASFGLFTEYHQYKEEQNFWDEYAETTEPILLMEDVIYAVLGRYDIAILKSNKDVWIQGIVWSRYHNQYYYVSEPTKVLEKAVWVTGGMYNHAALLEDGSVWTWGYNFSGNCGVTEKEVVSLPQKVAEDVVMVWTDFDNIKDEAISAKLEDNTVIRKSDGSYWICGTGAGEEKKVLPIYYEIANFECTCSDEFVPYVKK